MKKTIAIACLMLALAAPAVAQAHITLQPEEVPAGGFTRLDVRVPNERDNASTEKVALQFPDGFTTVSTEPVPGWRVKVTKSKLAQPEVNEEGEEITDRVDTITWTGDGTQGRIRPGEFQDFGLSVAVPDEPNTALTFKALQTYSNGEIVRWIGPPDAEEPAPRVRLTAETQAAPPAQADSGDEDEGGAPTWLAVLAVVLGGLGLVAGVGALAAVGRRRARA